jgi:carbonic anhydrase
MKKAAFAYILSLVLCVVPLLGQTATQESGGVSADAAINILKDGNAHYVAGKPQHPNQGQDRRQSTTHKGQHPFASILSCSDSRVPPEVIFDVGIGDVFVIRVAGNVANVDEIASIEYGADHLGTPLVVVLGHTHCGAVAAVVENVEAHGNIATLIKSIVPAVAAAKQIAPKATGDELVEAAVKANVWQAIDDLFKSSPITAGLVKSGKLQVVGALYDIDMGNVIWMGPHPNQDHLLAGTKKEGH